jgi:hypothetical protein
MEARGDLSREKLEAFRYGRVHEAQENMGAQKPKRMSMRLVPF